MICRGKSRGDERGMRSQSKRLNAIAPRKLTGTILNVYIWLLLTLPGGTCRGIGAEFPVDDLRFWAGLIFFDSPKRS